MNPDRGKNQDLSRTETLIFRKENQVCLFFYPGGQHWTYGGRRGAQSGTAPQLSLEHHRHLQVSKEELDPGPHSELRKTAGAGSAKNERGSSALDIHKPSNPFYSINQYD